LILFYKPNIGIKLVNKKNIDIVEKMTNIFLYSYIFPFEISYKRYFNFALIGAKEKTMNYYSKEIDKIKDHYDSICYISDGWDRKEKNNIFKEIKKYLLENGNIIKLEVNKEEKQVEDNKDKDKDKVDEKKDDKNNKMMDIIHRGSSENFNPFIKMDIEPNLSQSGLSIFKKICSPLKKDEKNDKEKEDKKEEKEKNEQNDMNEIIEEKKEEDKANEDEVKNENNMQIEEK
jgi:hypothetical protein